MPITSKIKSFWATLVRRQQVEIDLDDELSAWVDELTERKIRNGLDAEATRRAALLETGGMGQVKQRVREERVGFGLLALSRDLTYALRGLRRVPGYAAAFVLTLGLGIGANTAIFSVLNGVLLRPLPYPDADRIMYVEQAAVRSGMPSIMFSFPEVADYREQATTFDEFVEFGHWTFNVLDRGDPHRAIGGLVTPNYFKVLGIQPQLGRTLIPEDESPDAPPVAVLTHEYWLRVFGGDIAVVGQTLNLTVKQATIVGVLPPGSHYASDQPQDFYVNYAANDHYMGAAMQDERTHRMTDVFARLSPGATVDMARAEMSAISGRLRNAYPEAYPESRGIDIVVTPWIEDLTQEARPTLLILLGTAIFVLLIACANVANLTLTRLIRRERELAVRAALGAGGARLRGQLLVENLVLSTVGAVLGVVLAIAGLDLLVAYTARFTSRTGEIAVDGTVLALTLVVAVGTAILFAWAPRMPFTQDLGASLSASGGGRSTGGVSRRRTQRALVVCQLAFAFMLLVGAGLLIRTLVQLNQVDPGFDLANVLLLEAPDFTQQTPIQRQQFGNSVVERVEGYPGVVSAAMASAAPLRGSNPINREFRVEGRTLDGVMPQSVSRTVSPGYFSTAGTALVRGREFGRDDQPDSVAVTILSEAMARFYFEDEDPIGRRIAGWQSEGEANWMTIVGVVEDTKADGLDQDAIHTYYRSSTQGFTPSTFLVRADGDARPLAPEVVETIRTLDPNRPVDHIQTLEELRSESIAPQRLNATLFGIFSLLALVIATVGIAGVLLFSVSQRTQEFGIRAALGATRAQVLRMVLQEGALLAIIGLGVGGIASLFLSGLLSGLLFEVEPIDPISFLGSAFVLILVSITASLIPAWRATQVDPMVALRSD